MKRVPIVRVLAAGLGGLAAVAALSALVLAACASTGDATGSLIADARWVFPVASGAAVALLSWFLMADTPGREAHHPRRATAPCGLCGSPLLEDWRLCPYCGGLTEGEAPDGDRVSAGTA